MAPIQTSIGIIPMKKSLITNLLLIHIQNLHKLRLNSPKFLINNLTTFHNIINISLIFLHVNISQYTFEFVIKVYGYVIFCLVKRLSLKLYMRHVVLVLRKNRELIIWILLFRFLHIMDIYIHIMYIYLLHFYCCLVLCFFKFVFVIFI